MDLIQDFLEAFRFTYTLNVFKKEVNRNENLKMNRLNLANNFNVEIKNPEKQSVLVSLV